MTVRRSTFAVIFVIVYTVLISALFDNAAVYWCAVLVLLAICLWLGLKETKKINPYILFAVTPFTLLIYSNISDKYMVDL